MLVEVVDCCSDRERDVQDARDPNELLCEMLCSQKVCPGEDEPNRKDKREQNDCVRVEREVVLSIVDSSSAEAVELRVLVQSIAGNSNEAEEDKD